MEKEKLGQEPAFPIPSPDMTIEGQTERETQGMSKRFYAACCALQGLLASTANTEILIAFGTIGKENNTNTANCLIATAYSCADELLKQEQL